MRVGVDNIRKFLITGITLLTLNLASIRLTS